MDNFLAGLVIGLVAAFAVYIWRKVIEIKALTLYHQGLNEVERGISHETSRAADFVRSKFAEIRAKL